MREGCISSSEEEEEVIDRERNVRREKKREKRSFVLVVTKKKQKKTAPQFANFSPKRDPPAANWPLTSALPLPAPKAK